MNAMFEGRPSDSPYIEMIWRGYAGRNYAPVCPADVRWNLLFIRQGNRVRVSAEGATTQYVPKFQAEEHEFLVIKFKLGAFMPHLPADRLLNGDAILPLAAGRSFWLQGAAWQFPRFDNAETFVARLAREGVIAWEPVVNATLHGQSPAVSSRTVRRRFRLATGLTPTTIVQIERAQQAAALLEQGVPILDVVYQAGYADQPHLTRSLRRFIGQTPAQILQSGQTG
ncbi:MAG: helix-turn-helix transcriptional regulator [Chloroflexi bacterium]|nr:helix-turn-helix transcriptional regulator [Chloroflexota bacterium]